MVYATFFGHTTIDGGCRVFNITKYSAITTLTVGCLYSLILTLVRLGDVIIPIFTKLCYLVGVIKQPVGGQLASDGNATGQASGQVGDTIELADRADGGVTVITAGEQASARDQPVNSPTRRFFNGSPA